MLVGKGNGMAVRRRIRAVGYKEGNRYLQSPCLKEPQECITVPPERVQIPCISIPHNVRTTYHRDEGPQSHTRETGDGMAVRCRERTAAEEGHKPLEVSRLQEPQNGVTAPPECAPPCKWPDPPELGVCWHELDVMVHKADENVLGFGHVLHRFVGCRVSLQYVQQNLHAKPSPSETKCE